MSNNKQVVIAGAGPVGCVAALVLSRAGISVQMLEAEAELPMDLRASTFHPPTLDMLDGELGRLDAGTLSALLVAICQEAGFTGMDIENL